VIALFCIALLTIPGRSEAAPPHRARSHRPYSPLPFFALNPDLLPQAGVYTVTVNTGSAVNRINPMLDIGAGVDAEPAGASATIYSSTDVSAMLQAHFGAISYRLYGELGVECWHWNPAGTWSDPSGAGYFTGSSTPASAIKDSYLYGLEHRGFTNDQANDEDCSRLTDGDSKSYWKSNPYLAQPFTGESDTLHPQWLVADLGSNQPVNAIKIQWANPYATAYTVQYWTGDDAIGDPTNGSWQTFPTGTVTAGTGGVVTLTLASSPIQAEFIRVLMTASSYTYDTHGNADPRNSYGYAVCEIGIGTVDAQGAFHDRVVHSQDNTKQTVTYVSSVDPWHGTNRKLTDTEQPGLDRVFQSGLTRGIPAIIPVGVLYNTPENAVAELAYLEKQEYPIRAVEMGEEPDEQYILPEDYGALYLQFAKALHTLDPTLKLGGPVFAEGVNDVVTWPDAAGNTSWLSRFLAYLASHGASAELGFMSFEHYPFDPSADPWASLLLEPGAISGALQNWRTDGIPAGMPIFVTEYNFTWDYASAPLELVGALWHADMIGSLLASGGTGAFFYQAEPLPLAYSSGSDQWGAFPLLLSNASYAVRARSAQFYSMNMITSEWAEYASRSHDVYPAVTHTANGAGNALITAYAIHRPDGQWAVMLINKDPAAAHTVSIEFAGRRPRAFTGDVRQATLDSSQYVWHNDGANGSPGPDGPIRIRKMAARLGTQFSLPAGSLSVIRGHVQ
jgi:hypothetical protein